MNRGEDRAAVATRMSSDALRRLLMSPGLQPYLAVIKGARSGVVYGAKVRAPHALVMSLLFRPWK